MVEIVGAVIAASATLLTFLGVGFWLELTRRRDIRRRGWGTPG